MENAWQLFLKQLASADLEFTYDEVCGWSADEFEALAGAGLISEMAHATHLTCDSCTEAHREKVLWSADGKRAFITCPGAGVVDIDRERLRRWNIDLARLAILLATALELGGDEPQPAAAVRLWRLGRRRFGGRSWDFFFAAAPEEEVPSIIQAAQGALVSRTGLLLLPLRPETNRGWEPSRLQVAAVSEIASWRNGEITADLGLIEDLLTADGAAGKAPSVRSLPLPDTARWQDVLIEVFDTTLRVEVAGYERDLTFEEAGFGERDQRLEMLKLLAASRGKLAPEHASEVLSGKTPLKNRLYALRQLLQVLIPIDGNPVEHKKRAGVYVCIFQTRLCGHESFPTHANASWLDFRFIERRDGRLAISVNKQRNFRARQVERGSGRPVEEVAQVDEIVPHLYSFEDLKLRNSKGQLTPEGKKLMEILRGEGRLKGCGDDMAILKLGLWLQEWIGLEGDPLRYSESTQTWSAIFECSSEQGR